MLSKRINNIKGERTRLGYTQEQLARELGISVQSYQKKESGLVPFTEKQKFGIIKALDLDIHQANDFLFAGQLPIDKSKAL